MNINSIGQIAAAQKTNYGNPVPPSNHNILPESGNNIDYTTIDMSNVTFNQINDLIKSGITELLNHVPMESLTSHNPDKPFNYLKTVQDAIDSGLNDAKTVSSLQKTLDSLLEFDGFKLPKSINIEV